MTACSRSLSASVVFVACIALVGVCFNARISAADVCAPGSSLPPLQWPLPGEPDDRAVSLGCGDDWPAGDCPQGTSKIHVGVDLQASAGELVSAVEAGTVRAIPSAPQWASAVVIEHSGFTSVVWHVNASVGIGQLVVRGEQIATVADLGGNTHLHLGLRNAAYAEISLRGALPRTACAGDPAFPEFFVDPRSIAWTASSGCPSFVLAGRTVHGLGFEPGALWVTHKPAGQEGDNIVVSKLDPTDGTVLAESPILNYNGRGICAGLGSIWVTDALQDRVHELNPVTFAEMSGFSTPGSEPNGITFDGTYLWLADPYYQKIYKLTTAGQVVGEFPIPNDFRTGLDWDASNGGMWTNTAAAEFSHYTVNGVIDQTCAVPCLPSGGQAYDVAVGDGQWFVSSGSNIVVVATCTVPTAARAFSWGQVKSLFR